MGCISSKGICRSISIREELSHGFQSSASAWEELVTSNGSKDQLFALLSSSKLKLSSTDVGTNNSSSLVQFDGVAEGESSPDHDHDHDHGGGEPDSLRRSKSCQLPRDKYDRNQIGSRSFHTVEEYDALLERIHKLKDEYSWEDIKLKGSNSVELSPEKESGLNLDHKLNCDRENGWKRKAVGKGLKSLDVPSIEFPGVARFKQRVGVEEGQIYSPTTSYITPKFGSYNVGPVQEKECGGESRVFSPELVAAFEDCMQQLRVDEESILREIDGYSSVDDGDEIENGVVKHGM